MRDEERDLERVGNERAGDGPAHRTTQTQTRAAGLQSKQEPVESIKASARTSLTSSEAWLAVWRNALLPFRLSTAFRMIHHRREAIQSAYGCCVAPGKPRPMCPVHAMPPRLLGRKYNRSFQTTLTGCVLRSNHLEGGNMFRSV